MNTLKREMIYELLKVMDIVLAGACLFVALVASHYTSDFSYLEKLFSMRISLHNAFIIFCWGILWHIIFTMMGFYASRRFSTMLSEVWDIVKGITVITMILFIFQIFYPMSILTLKGLSYFWILSTAVFAGGRVVLRLSLKFLRKKGRNLRKILIIGTGKRAIDHAIHFTSLETYGYQVVGFVDDIWHGPAMNDHGWCKPVCDFKHFPEYIHNNVVDEIFIFLPFKSMYCVIADIIGACEEQGVIVRMALDFFNLSIARGKIEQIKEISMLTLYTGAMRRKVVYIKDVIDRSLAGVLLIVLSPLFAAVAAAIKCSSPGPVFFRQKRLGINKRPFTIYKFRTMIPNAEAKLKELEHLNEMGSGAGAFKLKNDPRITSLGKFLRKYSIDELPQLINVFRGEMCIVGPRPLTERDYFAFKLHRQIRRFSVKPGLTCLWQVSGRNDVPFDRWMELDMQYIDNWSLTLDLKIMLKTIPAIFRTKGAM